MRPGAAAGSGAAARPSAGPSRVAQSGAAVASVLEADQLPLFAPSIVRPDTPESAAIIDRFTAFHRANPHVYAEIRRRALADIRAGVARISVKFIVESIRRDPSVQTTGEYKINNSYTALYARLLATEPWMPPGCIEMRQRTAP